MLHLFRRAAVSYLPTFFGTKIKWRWYRSQLTRKLEYHVLVKPKIMEVRDSSCVTANQGFEKIRACFKI
jgi:hypothetical protein